MSSREIQWPPVAPRVLLATCMKDEGPFILEWLAWHKAIGVTDFVVFSNDCNDGTDLLLDILDEMGEITHLTNPAVALDRGSLQPMALRYVQTLPIFRRCDFFISMDVDEFVNVQIGDGTLADLFSRVEPFDVLSVFELVHGSNGHREFQREWVTVQFPRHMTVSPMKWKARTGVKSITRVSDRISEIRNHRPDGSPTVSDLVWLDGSGNRLNYLADDATQNGADCRGRRELVTLEHYPLRSLDSFMVKYFRGDVVVKNKVLEFRYWRTRNRHDEMTQDLSSGIERARHYHRCFEKHDKLMAQHEACCAAYEALIRSYRHRPEFHAFRQRILEEAWWEPQLC